MENTEKIYESAKGLRRMIKDDDHNEANRYQLILLMALGDHYAKEESDGGDYSKFNDNWKVIREDLSRQYEVSSPSYHREEDTVDPDDDSDYRIVYPNGNRKFLSVVEIVPALDYEIADYDVASQKKFTGDIRGARKYAKELADKLGFIYKGDDENQALLD